MFAAFAAYADEVTIVSDVLGAEGPLYVDGNLYYVAWISNTLSKWDGKTATILNHTPGCGHNGLVLTKQKTFMIACFDLGAILEVDQAGKELRRWETDNKGQKFEGGINDIVFTANGGAYATVFGPFVETPTSVIGKIIYLAPGSQKWIVVADDLNYANGIAVSPDQKTLYVCETVGNSIKKFTIHDDGSLSHRSNFAQLNVLTRNKVESWSPVKSTLADGQEISFLVTLSSNAQAGTFDAKVKINGSARGRVPVLQAEVDLIAIVLPDLQITAVHNATNITGSIRSVSIHLICKSVGITTTSIKTHVFVSLNNQPEVKVQDSLLTYSSSGQINPFVHQSQLALQSLRVRVVTDPDNTTVESIENNNQSVVTLTF